MQALTNAMLNYASLKNRRFADVEHRYSVDDSILYALGVGLGANPTDGAQLRFVYEKRLVALPSLSTVLAHPGAWLHQPETGIDGTKMVHGEQALRLHKPLQPEGHLIGRNRVSAIIDKGPRTGALLVQERILTDAQSGAVVATLEHSTLCRGEGGFSVDGVGGPEGSDPPRASCPPLPESFPDEVCELAIPAQSALIYRLSGDRNPLHADPEVALAAGFPRPILHGLASFGMACHAILKSCCSYEPERLKAMRVRFSAPAFPGQTLRFELWKDQGAVRFRARALGAPYSSEREVLTHGMAEID